MSVCQTQMWVFLNSEYFQLNSAPPLLKQQGLALAGPLLGARLSLSLHVSAEEPVLITNERGRETSAPSATGSLNRAGKVYKGPPAPGFYIVNFS